MNPNTNNGWFVWGEDEEETEVKCQCGSEFDYLKTHSWWCDVEKMKDAEIFEEIIL